MKMAKKNRLSQLFVEIWFKISGSIFGIKWNGMLNRKYISIMKKPYITALNIPLLFCPLVKKLTVSGIIGKTQGVISAISPPKSPKIKIAHNEFSSDFFSPQSAAGLLKSTNWSLYFTVFSISWSVISSFFAISILVCIASRF